MPIYTKILSLYLKIRKMMNGAISLYSTAGNIKNINISNNNIYSKNLMEFSYIQISTIILKLTIILLM